MKYHVPNFNCILKDLTVSSFKNTEKIYILRLKLLIFTFSSQMIILNSGYEHQYDHGAKMLSI